MRFLMPSIDPLARPASVHRADDNGNPAAGDIAIHGGLVDVDADYTDIHQTPMETMRPVASVQMT
eukprot:scaffold378513_cov18-Prasinocladus_malaysianus.AAC.1